MTSLTSTMFLLFTLLLTCANPVVADDCFRDNFGNIVCRNTFSNAARIGIAIGLFVLVLLLLCCATYMRRRRIQRINQAYVTNPNQGQQYYPQQTYQPPVGGGAPAYNYNQQPSYGGGVEGGYAPHGGYGAPTGPGSPPTYSNYAPPPGVPPAQK